MSDPYLSINTGFDRPLPPALPATAGLPSFSAVLNDRAIEQQPEESGMSLAESGPALVIPFVNSAGLTILRSLPQSDLDTMATIVTAHLAEPRQPNRGEAQRALSNLMRAGAIPATPGEAALTPEARLQQTYDAVLRSELSPQGITPNIVQWSVQTLPDWSPPTDFAAATRGLDGRGFATVQDAMFGGAGRATHEQNRLTQPFNVEAEHGYLVVKTSQDRFINIFVRGNAMHAATAQRLIASGADTSDQARAIDRYRLGTRVGPLFGKLMREGKTFVALVHSHPRTTGPRDRTESTHEFPSGSDLLGSIGDRGRIPDFQEAVVFLDAHNRLAMTVYAARQNGQVLDVSLTRYQNAERRNANLG